MAGWTGGTVLTGVQFPPSPSHTLHAPFGVIIMSFLALNEIYKRTKRTFSSPCLFHLLYSKVEVFVSDVSILGPFCR